MPDRRLRRLAPAGVVLLFLYFGCYTLPDYGIMWDCWEYYIGDKNLAFFTSLDWAFIRQPIIDLPLYHQPDHPNWFALLSGLKGNDAELYPHLIWPLGPTLAAAARVVFQDWLGWFDALDARHAVNLVLVGLLLACSTRPFAGARAAWPHCSPCWSSPATRASGRISM